MSLKQDPNQKTVNKEVKKKKKSINRTKDWSFYAIVISLIILAIPTTYIGYHIISAKLATGSVLTGSRFEGDLDPAITKENIETMKSSIQGIEGVESVSINLETATLRVNIKVSESFAKDSYPTLADSAYERVTEVTPIDTYFTSNDLHKMYDLEVGVYNYLKPTEEQKESFEYYMKSKTSSSEETFSSFLSDTKSPEFIQELIEKQTAPSESEKEKESTDA